MEEKIQLGDVIKFSAVGKRIVLPGVVCQFDSHSIYIKIDDKEVSIPYETSFKD